MSTPFNQKSCIKCGKLIPISPSHIKYPAYYKSVLYCSRGCPRSKNYNRQTNPRMYQIWSAMQQRCYNAENLAYKNYGGRGIKICGRWHEFENFYKDMVSTYSDDLTIDRIDNDKGYSPSNCQWVTPATQMRNRRNSKFITYKGKTQILFDWLKEMQTPPYRYYMRLKLGWTPLQAIGLEKR